MFLHGTVSDEMLQKNVSQLQKSVEALEKDLETFPKKDSKDKFVEVLSISFSKAWFIGDRFSKVTPYQHRYCQQCLISDLVLVFSPVTNRAASLHISLNWQWHGIPIGFYRQSSR